MAKKPVLVLLTKPVKDLGQTGEIVKIRPGFARNYLIPQKLAELATESVLARRQTEQAQHKQQQASALAQAQTLAKTLDGTQITVRVKAGQKGKLFGSVTAQDIVAALKDQHGLVVPAETLALPAPIKSLGKHTLTFTVAPKVTAAVTLQVVSSKS